MCQKAALSFKDGYKLNILITHLQCRRIIIFNQNVRGVIKIDFALREGWMCASYETTGECMYAALDRAFPVFWRPSLSG